MAIPGVYRASLLALACVGFATAATGDEHGHHQQAHVHGQAKLQVAVEGRTAELILQSPAANLLGFEHKPKNAEQKAALMETREWLTANPLVQTANSDCTVTTGSIHHRGDPEDGEEHGDDEHDEEGSHSDFEVTQRIECDSELTDPLVTPLMTRFPGIEHLSVDWLDSGKQGHTELHAGEDEIHLDH